jgi:hypothetical protein
LNAGAGFRKGTAERFRAFVYRGTIANGEYTASRLFLGKRRDNSNELLMSDTKGKPRIRLQVPPDGTPKLEFLGETGKTIYRLPENKPVKN